MSIRVNKIKKGYYDQHFTLTRIRWKTLDSDVKRCDEDTTLKANTTECITHHLEDKIGCSMGLSGSDQKLQRLIESEICFSPPCHSSMRAFPTSWFKIFFSRCFKKSQFIKYEQLNRNIYYGNDKLIHDMTGCLPKCNKYAYRVWPMTDLTVKRDTWNSDNVMNLRFYHTTGETEVREQVNMYNG